MTFVDQPLVHVFLEGHYGPYQDQLMRWKKKVSTAVFKGHLPMSCSVNSVFHDNFKSHIWPTCSKAIVANINEL